MQFNILKLHVQWVSRAMVQDQQNILIFRSHLCIQSVELMFVVHAFEFAVNFVGSYLMFLKHSGFWNFPITNGCSFSVPSELIK
jgi:hypothetical protein